MAIGMVYLGRSKVESLELDFKFFLHRALKWDGATLKLYEYIRVR